MSTPLPGRFLSTQHDAYNFYLSQIRITIERAFGILIHRWGVLRRPLAMTILTVPSLVWCLLRLHIYCVNNDSRHTCCPELNDERSICRAARRAQGEQRHWCCLAGTLLMIWLVPGTISVTLTIWDALDLKLLDWLRCEEWLDSACIWDALQWSSNLLILHFVTPDLPNS